MPRAGVAALLPCGRGTRPRPRWRGTGGEGPVSRRSGRDKSFRGWGRTCRGRRRVASGVAVTVRKAGLPPAGESGTGAGPSAAVTARSGGRRASNGRRGLARGARGAAVAAGLGVDATLCRQALGTLDGAGMVKAPTSKGAPGDPAAQPGLVRKLTQKKKKKKRFWPNKAREVSEKPAGDPKVVVVRPPKAPEDFSQNWKALQELLKQKSQALETPAVISQKDSKQHPEITQRNGKAKRDELGTGTTARQATGGSGPPGSLTDRKAPAPPTKAKGAGSNEKGTKKRTNGDMSPKRGDLKHKKRKAKEAAAALAPAPPTEEDIWFDDVDPADIEAAVGPEAAAIARKRLGHRERSITLVKEQAFGGLTRALALDCEMVGVGPAGEDSIAARVSIVNQFGKCVYDKYVKPTQEVTDYRTAVSGVRPENLKQGEEFEVVQKEVAEMLRGRILVGHALYNDLKVLFLDHPKKKIRDTQKYKPFKSQVKSGRPSLKLLAERILGVSVQHAEHCSIQDAQAAMRLYVTVKKEWERMAQDRRPATAADHSAQE